MTRWQKERYEEQESNSVYKVREKNEIKVIEFAGHFSINIIKKILLNLFFYSPSIIRLYKQITKLNKNLPIWVFSHKLKWLRTSTYLYMPVFSFSVFLMFHRVLLCLLTPMQFAWDKFDLKKLLYHSKQLLYRVHFNQKFIMIIFYHRTGSNDNPNNLVHVFKSFIFIFKSSRKSWM